MTVDLFAIAVVIAAAIAIATVARFVRHMSWSSWFELGVWMSLCGLLAFLAIGFVTAPAGGSQ